MKRMTLLAMMGLTLGGCARDPAAQEQPRDEPPPAEKAAQAPAAEARPAGPAIGIPACDEYFRQAQICFAKNPVMKAQIEGSLDALRARLIEDARDPSKRDNLAYRCAAHTGQLIEDCDKPAQ